MKIWLWNQWFRITHPRQALCDNDVRSCGCPRGEGIARAKRLRRLGWFTPAFVREVL